ncbi:MAG: class I SAM-dependent methyltransferase, partial [Polyangiaceae bacterium]|nr:class I SAM-dependent methyltransferase [Polyangiaceae bacterium]
KAVPGLHLLECVEFLGMPELIDRLSRGSALKQTVHRTMNRLSFYRHLVRHVRYAFGPD